MFIMWSMALSATSPFFWAWLAWYVFPTSLIIRSFSSIESLKISATWLLNISCQGIFQIHQTPPSTLSHAVTETWIWMGTVHDIVKMIKWSKSDRSLILTFTIYLNCKQKSKSFWLSKSFIITRTFDVENKVEHFVAVLFRGEWMWPNLDDQVWPGNIVGIWIHVTDKSQRC